MYILTPLSMRVHRVQLPYPWACLPVLFFIAHLRAFSSQHRRHRYPPSQPHKNHRRNLQVNLDWNYLGFQLFDSRALSRFDIPDSCKDAL